MIAIADKSLIVARRAARQAVSAPANSRIEVIEGAAAPTLAGQGWHWRTKGGKRIDHPSAYSRKGWSSMVYVASTRRVVVGREWLSAAAR